jgi:creatinine amidohydrolase
MRSGMTSPTRSYLLTDLPWTEVAAHLERDRRLIVPVGACDQHGPHLPLGAATCVAEALAADLAREFGVLRAPAFPFGVNVPSERSYAGTSSLKPKTLHRALNELLASWAAQGFDEFVCITADLHEPHAESIATVYAAGARVRVVEALSVDLSAFLEGGPEPQHGGEILTSLLLHLRPAAVRMEAAADFRMDAEGYRRYARGRLDSLPDGCAGSIGAPTLATAEKGSRMYEHILGKIRQKVFIAPADPATAA